jgi:hypothetical protein
MKRLLTTLALALGGCEQDRSAFEPDDEREDERDESGRAVYAVSMGQHHVAVRVWSNGAYLGAERTPLAHVGFKIENAASIPVWFDLHVLHLSIYGPEQRALPAPRLVSTTPPATSRICVAAGATSHVDTYFALATHPREVHTMESRWAVQSSVGTYEQVTAFARDDDWVVYE